MSEAYWHDCVEVLGTQPLRQKAEGKIALAAERASISPRAAKSLYYFETTDPKSSVGFRIRSAAEEQAHRFLAVADSLEKKDAEFFARKLIAFGIWLGELSAAIVELGNRIATEGE